MYNKLLISAGGGIIARNQQADQDDCATIAIGLGGTGISCLRALKKEVYTRVKPDDSDALVAQYRHIKYLAVDTDQSSIGDNGAVDTLDGNTEFFNISCPDITGLLGKAHLLAQDPALKWLKTKETQGNGAGISILSAEAGAGGVRQIGRLLLLQNCRKFVEKLTHIITEARKGLMGNPNINIHIFTGMAGGTGAGIFLDVCYILQHVLETMGLAGQAYTCGYFFLPDVNIANGVDYDYIQVNGFAAMKELDYAMNYDNNGGQWSQNYDGFQVTTAQPPVKLAHLITATNSQGAIRENGYAYAMHVAVDYVLEYIIKPYVSTGDDLADGVFSIKSHIANVATLIGVVNKRHGACYNYCVLGAANSYLPYKDITTYLTSKIFAGFSYLPDRHPSEADVDAFVQDHGLSYKELFRELLRDVPGIPNYDVDPRVLAEQTEQMSSDLIPGVLKPVRDATSKISGKLAENRTALLNTNASAGGGANGLLALMERTKAALVQIACRPEKGPYYACELLGGLKVRNLKSKIRGCQTENTENLKKARADLSLRETEMADALLYFQNPPTSAKLNPMDTQKKRAEDYKNAVRNYFIQRARIDQLTAMEELLSGFEKQLDSLNTGFFRIFEDVLANLQATFASNLSTLAEPVAEDTGYAVKLMKIEEDGAFRDSLDKTVEGMRIEDQIHDFVSAMLDKPEVWITQDENKISDAVTSHFLGQLGEYTRRTMMDYLRIKFKIEKSNSGELLKDKIYNDIILPLDQNANPLFWTETGYQLSDAAVMGYLSIPAGAEEIKAAAEQYKLGRGGSDIRVRTSWSSDRITLFSFRCGVPLFGYKGVANYKSEYRRRAITGSHLYEGSVGDPRDSRALVNITPVSRLREEEYTEKEREDLALYARAWDAGVLSKEMVGSIEEYHLNLFDQQAVEDWIAQADQIVEKKDVLAGEAHGKLLAPPPVASYRVIPNTGAAAVADQVIRDHVVDSLLYMGVLRGQLALLDRLAEKKQELSAKVNEWGAFASDMHTFALGLFSGVIRKENDYTYVYVTDTFGLEEQTELTTIDAEPFGMDLPLYSAYQGFSNLSGEEKSGVGRTVKQYLVNKKETVDAACAGLKEELSGARMNSKLSVAKTSYPAQAEEIIGFFKRLAVEFNNFMATR